MGLGMGIEAGVSLLKVWAFFLDLDGELWFWDWVFEGDSGHGFGNGCLG